MTNDTSCQTDFQSKIGRPRYNDSDDLISASLNKHIKSLEKQLDEKKIIIYTFLQNIHNCSNKNLVANSNHKADKVSFENLNSYEKSKMISNKSNPADDDDSQNNIDNHKKASETKDEQSMTLDKRIDKSSPTPIGDKIPEKETKKQLIESSRHHSDIKNNVTPTEKTKKKTAAKVGDSIVRNVPSRSLNQSLKEYFRIVKPFPGPTTQDMKDYIKPTIARNQDMVILHTGTNDLKSKQNPSDIANEIINLAKISGTEVSISSLIPLGD